MHANEREPKHAAPEPTNVRVQSVGELKENLKGDWHVLAEFWTMDATVYVVVDEVVYRVFALDNWMTDAGKTDVVTYDPTGGNWIESTRDAMTFGAELAIALTVLAIG